MRICMITLDFKPYRSSGLAVYAEDLANGLLEAGHEVTVIASLRSGLPAQHWVDGVRVCRVAFNRLDWISFGLVAARLLRRLQAEHSYHIVHFLDVHFAYASTPPFVASVWQSFRQRLTAHLGLPARTGKVDWLRREAYYRIARRCMEQPSLIRATRLIASCHSTRQEFIEHYHVPPGRIDLGLQGINTEFFRPVPTGALRRSLGLEGCKVLLFAGFITPRKGSEYLARALQILPENVHLLLMGRWSRHCRERFFAEVGPAAGRVHELGYVSDEERPGYYSLADVYVSPSMLEGLGITPIEAQACGTPAIVTSASSGPEEVGDAGLVVPPCDPDALAGAIRHLLEDDDLRRELGRRGRERVLVNFSYQRMARLTLDTYERSLQGAEARHHASCADQSL